MSDKSCSSCRHFSPNGVGAWGCDHLNPASQHMGIGYSYCKAGGQGGLFFQLYAGRREDWEQALASKGIGPTIPEPTSEEGR